MIRAILKLRGPQASVARLQHGLNHHDRCQPIRLSSDVMLSQTKLLHGLYMKESFRSGMKDGWKVQEECCDLHVQ